MQTETQAFEVIEIPKEPGFYRTPFGFYVPDHKAPPWKVRDVTFEWLYRDGTRPISNTDWSRVATLTREDIARIEDSEIRNETLKAQGLMLGFPAQFVGLSVRGNRVLEEPDGFGVYTLETPLTTGHIEVYDNDIRKIILGEPQTKYQNAELWIDESAKQDDTRYAVRSGASGAVDGRFDVDLDFGPRYSGPDVAGLGFRPYSAGNAAYVPVNEACESIIAARTALDRAEKLLK